MVIKDPSDLIPVIEKLVNEVAPGSVGDHRVWWRGQPVSSWELRPGVYRNAYTTVDEQRANITFKLEAPARYEKCPTANVDWLFLMQHYGMKTRLLDWTRSPLVALFFAISDRRHDRRSANLFALNPWSLNLLNNYKGISSGDDLLVTAIANEAFPGNYQDGMARAEVVAVYPPRIDVKVIVQQAMCTIHGTSAPRLEDFQKNANTYFPKNAKFLEKATIPASKKPELRKFLGDYLGIRKDTVFPDLYYLAEHLVDGFDSNAP